MTCTSLPVTAPSSPSTATEFRLCILSTWDGTEYSVCSGPYSGVTFSGGTQPPKASPLAGYDYNVASAWKQQVNFTLTGQSQLGASDGSSITAKLVRTDDTT